jgi:hypothetical protein
MLLILTGLGLGLVLFDNPPFLADIFIEKCTGNMYVWFSTFSGTVSSSTWCKWQVSDIDADQSNVNGVGVLHPFILCKKKESDSPSSWDKRYLIVKEIFFRHCLRSKDLSVGLDIQHLVKLCFSFLVCSIQRVGVGVLRDSEAVLLVDMQVIQRTWSMTDLLYT